MAREADLIKQEEERMSTLDGQIEWAEANIENETERLELIATIKEEHKAREEATNLEAFEMGLQRAEEMAGSTEEEIRLMLEKEKINKETSDKIIKQMQVEGQVADSMSSFKEKLLEEGQKALDKNLIKEKQAKIKETIEDTKSMATKAYKSLAGIPIVGPALGAVAAAIAMAYGMKQVADIKSAQYGADFITDGPQMMMVGEGAAGTREHVQVTPLDDPNIDGPQGQNITLNVSGNVMTDDFVESTLVEKIRESLRLGEDMGV